MRAALLLTATLVVTCVVSSDVTAQSSTPRLPDGRPDLNGTWIPAGPARGAQLKLPNGSICVTNCADLLPAGAAAGRDGAAGPAAPGRGGARGAAAPPQ